MKKRLTLTLLLTWSLLTLTSLSCNNNMSSNSTISVDINGNSGCTVISYYDGGSPITMITNGSFANYPGVPNGTHSVSIYTLPLGFTGNCSFVINNNSHFISVYNPCGSGFGTTCN